MAKIKVLHLIDSSGMYGAESVVLTLLDNLKASTIYHCILGCIKEPQNDYVELGRLAEKIDIPVAYFPMRRGISLLGVLKILLYIKNNNIQLIHSHGFKPNIYLGLMPKRILNVKVISTIHGWAKKYADRKLAVYEKINCFFIKRFSRCIAVSASVKQDLLKKGIPSDKIIIIYNGINLDKGRKRSNSKKTKEEFNIPTDAFVIGTAGRLVKEKGMDIFIKSAALFKKHNPDAFFLIAGDGPLLADLKNKVKKLGIEQDIRFLGFIENIYEFLSILDIFVLSSLTEGLPMILLEAMNAGCSVVCSKVGGTPEVITDGINGLLIDPNKPDVLYEKLMFLHNNPSLKEKISLLGQVSIKKMFSATSMANKYIKLYDTLY